MNRLVQMKRKLHPEFPADHKVCEEMAELSEAFIEEDEEHILEELSDVVFCLEAYMDKHGYTYSQLVRLADEKGRKRFPEEYL